MQKVIKGSSQWHQFIMHSDVSLLTLTKSEIFLCISPCCAIVGQSVLLLECQSGSLSVNVTVDLSMWLIISQSACYLSVKLLTADLSI